METTQVQCLVVGAGITGLLAARRLQQEGMEVVVLDKGRRPGGRLATRTLRHETLGDGLCDHGAQFFTVRSPAFRDVVDEWIEEGVVQEWCRGFANQVTGKDKEYPRYRGRDGMKSIPLHLTKELDVRTSVRVRSLWLEGEHWQLRTEDGGGWSASAVLLTPPLPQSLALLDAGNVTLPSPARQQLDCVKYAPCIAVLALLDSPSSLPEPGGMRLTDGPLAWLADNRKKGISPLQTALTLHATAEFSEAHWGDSDERVCEELLGAARRWIPEPPAQTYVHRWRYSKPCSTFSDPIFAPDFSSPLLLAGDAFGGPRVEGAAVSGFAAANQLLQSRWT